MQISADVLQPPCLTGANFKELVYLINADKTAHSVEIGALAGKAYVLHTVHRTTGAADARAATAAYSAAGGRFDIPARTAVVFVVE